jgi:hypothetical protein
MGIFRGGHVPLSGPLGHVFSQELVIGNRTMQWENAYKPLELQPLSPLWTVFP